MGYRYTSLEDGQVIETAEPRADLDELARWVRSDAAPAAPAPTSVGAPNTVPVAGPVNTSPVTGGEPPLTSIGAGIANPGDTLSTEQAQQQAAEALQGDVAPPLQAQVETSGDPDARPALNGSTADWQAYAKRPEIGLDVTSDDGRDVIVAAYIEKFAPAGNASGADWAKYAADHGVTIDNGAGRDAIRAATVEAGWAKGANA